MDSDTAKTEISEVHQVNSLVGANIIVTYLVTSFDQDTALRVREILLNTPKHNPYTVLKTRLTETFTITSRDQANRLLSIKCMGDRKPPELMCDIIIVIINLNGTKGSCYITEQIFINAMPPSVKCRFQLSTRCCKDGGYLVVCSAKSRTTTYHFISRVFKFQNPN